MFAARVGPRVAKSSMSRTFSSTTKKSSKVAVLGAAGGIGQPLSMLLKLSPHVADLACYDIVGTPGIAADLSHIPTKAQVSGTLPSPGAWPPKPNDGLKEALTGAEIVSRDHSKCTTSVHTSV